MMVTKPVMKVYLDKKGLKITNFDKQNKKPLYEFIIDTWDDIQDNFIAKS